MRILGMAFSGHGAAMCVVDDGRLVRAVNLERLTRTKFSLAALSEIRSTLSRIAVDHLGYQTPPTVFDFYEVFPRMLRYLTGEERLDKAGIDLVVKTSDTISVDDRPELREAAGKLRRYFGATPVDSSIEHHQTHAYQAFLCSPFEEAAVLTVDGAGEKLERLNGAHISTTFGVGRGNRVDVLKEILLPNSVGALYSAVTRHLGFREEQEGNTMALAAFGSDAFYGVLRPLVDVAPDGGYSFARTASGDLAYEAAMKAYAPKRERGAPLEQVHKDIAWACQAVSEEILINAARALYDLTGLDRLAVAGGVGLNCVANSKILAETPFRQLYVMPNASDRGLSVGCAMYGYHVLKGGSERHPPTNDYLGREYGEAEILAALRGASGVSYRRSPDIAAEVASLLASGHILGWVQGGAEFGPRALGHRSIVADPRTPESKARLDAEIKKREWFRPYAPSVLAERAAEYFELDDESPYMLLAPATRASVVERVQGIVHVDGTARVQTVDREQDVRYRRLIEEFDKLTGVPIVMNTSFNGYGEPIVETPENAVQAFLQMNLDALAVGDYVVWREGAPPPGEDPRTPS